MQYIDDLQFEAPFHEPWDFLCSRLGLKVNDRLDR